MILRAHRAEKPNLSIRTNSFSSSSSSSSSIPHAPLALPFAVSPPIVTASINPGPMPDHVVHPKSVPTSLASSLLASYCFSPRPIRLDPRYTAPRPFASTTPYAVATSSAMAATDALSFPSAIGALIKVVVPFLRRRPPRRHGRWWFWWSHHFPATIDWTMVVSVKVVFARVQKEDILCPDFFISRAFARVVVSRRQSVMERRAVTQSKSLSR